MMKGQRSKAQRFLFQSTIVDPDKQDAKSVISFLTDAKSRAIYPDAAHDMAVFEAGLKQSPAYAKAMRILQERIKQLELANQDLIEQLDLFKRQLKEKQSKRQSKNIKDLLQQNQELAQKLQIANKRQKKTNRQVKQKQETIAELKQIVLLSSRTEDQLKVRLVESKIRENQQLGQLKRALQKEKEFNRSFEQIKNQMSTKIQALNSKLKEVSSKLRDQEGKSRRLEEEKAALVSKLERIEKQQRRLKRVPVQIKQEVRGQCRLKDKVEQFGHRLGLLRNRSKVELEWQLSQLHKEKQQGLFKLLQGKSEVDGQKLRLEDRLRAKQIERIEYQLSVLRRT